MVDNDGKYSYSNVVVIAGTKGDKIVINKVNPNPFKTEIIVDISSPQQQQVSVQLVDMAGRISVNRSFDVSAGDNKLLLNRLGELGPGIYFIKVITTDAILQQKVLKLDP